MDDNRIVELLLERNEAVLEKIERKYSRLYKGIIRAVLQDACDIDECANDVLLAVWNSIPPNKPTHLTAYLCKLARYISIDKLRYNASKKRSSAYTVTLSELGDCLPNEVPITDTQDQSTLIRQILSDFLSTLDAQTEILFIRRYVYLESVTDLANRFHLQENHVSVKLYRARKKLKKLLEKEGIRI